MSYRSRRFSPGSAVATGCAFAALMAALIAGLSETPLGPRPEGRLIALTLAPPPAPPPPERPPPHIVRAPRPEGKAAPAGLRARATDLVLPPPMVARPPPVLMVSAPTPGAGTASHAGSSDTPGPGAGAGGSGNGTGGGAAGDDEDDGGTAPVQRRGRLKMSDFPDSAGEVTRDWVVGVRYLVDVDGRVARCEITGPSGLPALDAATCHLIQQRFRFDPSRDAAGRPVPAWVVETHGWGPERRPDEDTDQ